MVVSDHHTASPQEFRVLVGRPRSRNHNPVPPPTTTTADRTVTAAARRTTAFHVTLDRGADMPPSSARWHVVLTSARGVGWVSGTHPRPPYGMVVASTVMVATFASSGSPAM